MVPNVESSYSISSFGLWEKSSQPVATRSSLLVENPYLYGSAKADQAHHLPRHPPNPPDNLGPEDEGL